MNPRRPIGFCVGGREFGRACCFPSCLPGVFLPAWQSRRQEAPYPCYVPRRQRRDLVFEFRNPGRPSRSTATRAMCTDPTRPFLSPRCGATEHRRLAGTTPVSRRRRSCWRRGISGSRLLPRKPWPISARFRAPLTHSVRNNCEEKGRLFHGRLLEETENSNFLSNVGSWHCKFSAFRAVVGRDAVRVPGWSN